MLPISFNMHIVKVFLLAVSEQNSDMQIFLFSKPHFIGSMSLNLLLQKVQTNSRYGISFLVK
jgi:hypothetical protein